MNERLTEFIRSPGSGTGGDYAVFFTKDPAGGPSEAAEELETYLGQCSILRRWAASGRVLTDTAEGLEVLEELLDGPAGSRPPGSRLRIETGLFIGTVLVRNLPTARWQLLANGYPVIHLTEHSDLDVMAIARARLSTGTPDLRTVLPSAQILTQQGL